MMLTESRRHLTYCLNIHPGETWPEVLHAVRTHARAVRDRVGAGQAFGLGLRLGQRAAEQLGADDEIKAFADFMADDGLYVFTINGFPHGAFHGTPVKTSVYEPDWRKPQRRDYTKTLIDILARLVPSDTHGSISTVPGSYKQWIDTDDDVCRMAENLADCAAHADQVRETSGRTIEICLEPEPDCFLETTDETLSFLTGRLLEHGVPHLCATRECTNATAETILRRHIGVCLDTCHVALQYEPLGTALRRYEDAGVRVSKIQVSAALKTVPTPEAQNELGPFDEPVYLHQVKARHADTIVSYPDLPRALAAAAAAGADEWRVHFHVPLYFTGSDWLGSTAAELDADFFEALEASSATHLEIETYTYDVLPAELRASDVAESIAREYEWLLPRLSSTASDRPVAS